MDDDDAFRQAISVFLREQFSAIEIREASNYGEALQQIDDLDLVFVDISLPGENGLELTAKLKSTHPGIVVSILTMHDSPEYREAAFEQGADYFVSKGARAEKILEVVQSALARTHPNHTLF
ncbi:MAG: response regulator transcription factor [Nitrososphaera sp.]|nr:response regulator transcription factor [Nitrososphaera sp.]